MKRIDDIRRTVDDARYVLLHKADYLVNDDIWIAILKLGDALQLIQEQEREEQNNV